MADQEQQQFGHVDFITPLEADGGALTNALNPKFAIGPCANIEFMGNTPIFGPAVSVSFKAKLRAFYGPTVSSDRLNLSTLDVNNTPIPRNIIANTDSASIMSDILISGIVTPNYISPFSNTVPNILGPTGVVNIIDGVTFNVININRDITLRPQDSYFFYRNIGATGVQTINIPSMPNNYMFAIMTHGQNINLNPQASQNIFIPNINSYKGAGSPVIMSGANTAAMFICIGSNIKPMFFRGTMI